MSHFDQYMKQLTDKEIERQLEELTFTIALNTAHFHACSGHARYNFREELQANKQAFRNLRQERERRIIACDYKP